MRRAPYYMLSVLGTLAAFLCTWPSVASASKPETRAQAQDALTEAQQALDGDGVRTGREATPALARLAAGKSLLASSERREANSVLARPTDGAADPLRNGYTTSEEAPYCTSNFCVHYVSTTADAPSPTDANADGVPDYVKDMADQFEYVHSIENGADQMGWQPPKPDEGRGGSGQTDVYIEQLGDQRIYGYAAPEENASSSYSYVVMDNDYSASDFGSSTQPGDALKTTAAHEYNHVLQFTYDSYQDDWMLESSATWAEEQVYPAVSGYLGYLPTWASCATLALTSYNRSGTNCQRLKVYGSAVWNHWLTARSSRDVIRAAWEISQANGDFAPAAYSSAIAAQPGGVDFTDEFDRFAAAVAEWRAPGSAFPDRASYPDVSRSGSLTIDGAPRPSEVLDHTTFRLIDVTPDPAKGQARLHAELPSGLRGALALVGRTGSSNTEGTVTTVLQQLPSGGTGDVTLPNPGSYGRITAVLVNADPERSGYSYPTRDWIWTRDGQPFANVGVFSDPPPSPTVPPMTATPPTTTTTSPTAAPAPTIAAPVKPALAISARLARRQKLRTAASGGILLRLSCNQRCSATTEVRMDARTAKALNLKRLIGRSTISLSRSGARSFRIRLSKRPRALLRKRSRAVKLTVRVRATDYRGLSKSVSPRLSLTP